MDNDGPFSRELRSARDRIHEVNRAAAALLGIEQRFLAGKPLAAYVAGSDRWGFHSMVGRLQRGEDERVSERPQRFRRRGGARRQHLEALEDLDPAGDLDGSVQVLVDAGVRLLGVDGTGLMLADTQGRLCAAGGSDEATMAFLRAQEHAVKGPCLHAFLLERPVQAGSLAGDPRWPQLAEAASVNGVGAALATPIGLYGGPIGALLVFSTGPRAWTDGDAAAAEAYASVLAALLELAAEAQRGSSLPRQVQHLLQGQAVVEQAKGALMARRGIDAEAAGLELRQLARRSGRPLAEAAASLLRRLGRDPG
jgi:hypothetical protein